VVTQSLILWIVFKILGPLGGEKKLKMSIVMYVHTIYCPCNKWFFSIKVLHVLQCLRSLSFHFSLFGEQVMIGVTQGSIMSHMVWQVATCNPTPVLPSMNIWANQQRSRRSHYRCTHPQHRGNIRPLRINSSKTVYAVVSAQGCSNSFVTTGMTGYKFCAVPLCMLYHRVWKNSPVETYLLLHRAWTMIH
jgi:hypothetical protein